MGDALGDDVLLFAAVDSFGDNVAGALNYMTPSTIFGRVWGKRSGVDFKNLHFELSYYQVLIYCFADHFEWKFCYWIQQT